MKHAPDNEEVSIFEQMAIHHYPIILLWELNPKTGRPIRPAVTFTPTFPGEGFNHTVQMRLGGLGDKHSIPCPCGLTLTFTVTREAKGDDGYSVEHCGKCLSWHSVRWQMPVMEPYKKSRFILC